MIDIPSTSKVFKHERVFYLAKVTPKIRKACNLYKGRLLSVHLSLVMRKPDFCICENKDADQLPGNREADQRLCFRYIDSTIPLLS